MRRIVFLLCIGFMGASGALAEELPRRVAVLPFAAPADSPWMGPAVADAVAAKLACVRGLVVVERGEIATVLQAHADAATPALFGAEGLIVGSIQAPRGWTDPAAPVRITAKLVGAETGRVASSVATVLDGTAIDLFRMETDLAHAAARALGTEPEWLAIAACPEKNLRARQLYGEGLVAFDSARALVPGRLASDEIHGASVTDLANVPDTVATEAWPDGARSRAEGLLRQAVDLFRAAQDANEGTFFSLAHAREASAREMLARVQKDGAAAHAVREATLERFRKDAAAAAPALYDLARACEAQGQWDAAIRSYQDFLRWMDDELKTVQFVYDADKLGQIKDAQVDETGLYAVVVAYQGKRARLIALDSRTGTLRYDVPLGVIAEKRNGFALGATRIAILSDAKTIQFIDKRTGARLSQFAVPPAMTDLITSTGALPATTGQTPLKLECMWISLHFTAGEESVVAYLDRLNERWLARFSCETGAMAWYSRFRQYMERPLRCLHGEHLHFTTNVAVDLADGQLIPKPTCPPRQFLSGSMPYMDLYLSDAPHREWKRNGRNTELYRSSDRQLLWRFESTNEADTVIADFQGLLYLRGNEIVCVRPPENSAMAFHQARALMGVGRCHMRQNRIDEGTKAFQMARQINAADVSVYLEWAGSLPDRPDTVKTRFRIYQAALCRMDTDTADVVAAMRALSGFRFVMKRFPLPYVTLDDELPYVAAAKTRTAGGNEARNVAAYDRRSGAILWSRPGDGELLMHDGRHVLASARRPKGFGLDAVLLDAATGSELGRIDNWHVAHAFFVNEQAELPQEHIWRNGRAVASGQGGAVLNWREERRELELWDFSPFGKAWSVTLAQDHGGEVWVIDHIITKNEVLLIVAENKSLNRPRTEAVVAHRLERRDRRTGALTWVQPLTDSAAERQLSRLALRDGVILVGCEETIEIQLFSAATGGREAPLSLPKKFRSFHTLECGLPSIRLLDAVLRDPGSYVLSRKLLIAEGDGWRLTDNRDAAFPSFGCSIQPQPGPVVVTLSSRMRNDKYDLHAPSPSVFSNSVVGLWGIDGTHAEGICKLIDTQSRSGRDCIWYDPRTDAILLYVGNADETFVFDREPLIRFLMAPGV